MSADFVIPAGLPFARQFSLIDGQAVWPTEDDLEVRCQLRAGRGSTTRLISNLHQFMATEFIDGRDLGTVSLAGTTLTGDDADFTDADIGRRVSIADAGTGGLPLVARITAVTDGTHATLDAAAVQDVADVAGRMTDDIVVTWSMTGAQTRELYALEWGSSKIGYANLVFSDVGPTDARAASSPLWEIRAIDAPTTAEGDS